MIAIIDYGVGNLFSLRSSFAAIGSDVAVTADERIIASADRVILPGDAESISAFTLRQHHN